MKQRVPHTQEGKDLAEKLLDVPTELHVDYQQFGDPQQPFIFALWKEESKAYCIALGQDHDGLITDRIAAQERRVARARAYSYLAVQEWIPLVCSQHPGTYSLPCAECLAVHKENRRHKARQPRVKSA